MELNTYYQIYTLESVAHWYVDKAKLKVQKDWAAKAADVKGNAYIIPVVSMEGKDRAHIRFEISGQKAWIAEWGRGTGVGNAAQRTVINGVDLGSRNPYANQYRESAQFNPVRRQFNENTAGLHQAKEDLIKLLARYHVASPARWIDQIPALLDKREMVELRHSLILRRQALREQIDYNNNLAGSAKEEITGVARAYPMYAQEILEMTEKFEPEGAT